MAFLNPRAVRLGCTAAFALFVSGCGDASTTEPTPTPLNGSISGSVVVNGTGVSGVGIALSGASGATTTSDDSGAFGFTGLPAGSYTVQITTYPDSLRFDGTSQDVVLTTSARAKVVVFSGRLPSPGALKGHVLLSDASGGVAGATVTASRGSLATTTTTAGDGAYEFASLSIGEWTLRVRFPLGTEADGDTVATVSIKESETATRDFSGSKVASGEAMAQPGESDTLAVAGGVVLVDGAGLATPVEIVLDSEDGGTGDWDGVQPLGDPVTVALSGPSGGSSRRSPEFASAVAPTGISMLLRLVGGASSSRVNARVEVDGQNLVFSVSATATTFVDPVTGVEETMALIDLPVPGSGVSLKATFAAKLDDTDCDARQLVDHETLGGNTSGIPLILVHGWQPTDNTCEEAVAFDPVEETWKAFLSEWGSASSEVRSKYRVMVLRYPTYESIGATSAWLADEMVRQGLSGAVIVGHSMGGLVGRGLLASVTDVTTVRALITLGTPHEGSPMATFSDVELFAPALLTGCGASALLTSALGFGLDVITDGYRDLSPNRDFIQSLIDRKEDGPRIYTYGGVVNDLGGAEEGGAVGPQEILGIPGLFNYVSCALGGLLAWGTVPNDLVVSESSALPDWTAIQRSYSGVNHLDITDRSSVLRDVRVALESLIECAPAPAPLASNDFNLSASVARRTPTEVDVTVNAVVVDGVAVDGLGAENFVVMEDGCIRDFELTTGEGSVGVDIAFVQDLSGSMRDAVSGVRSSVVEFADALATGGLDVRYGAIGYSGPGTIPSSPASSECEYLGPSHPFSDVASFRSHVQAEWSVSGGCDLPENGLEAIEWAHGSLAWRAGAARVYVDITDASHHLASTDCNGAGACTDQTLESIVSLMGGGATIHVVAPSSSFARRRGGGLDPWALAEATGGVKMALVESGFDLNELGIGDVLQQVSRLSFTSSSENQASHHLRVRVVLEGQQAEFAPGVIYYQAMDPALSAR